MVPRPTSGPESPVAAAAGAKEVPKAATAVFVGAEFDSVKGRGGDDDTPIRKTPWGEIAWQMGLSAGGRSGAAKVFALVAEHEKTKTAPGGEVIRQFFPKDRPSLILMDELMNYVSRNRKSGLGSQLYNFLQNLSEVARGLDGVVLAVSIPASELEMTAEDQSDYERFKKMLDRLGKAIVMSAEAEASEIIRRRLFEWDERAITNDGKVMLSKEALETCNEYGDWVVQHRQTAAQLVPPRQRCGTVRSDLRFTLAQSRCLNGSGRSQGVFSKPAACCGCWHCGCRTPTSRVQGRPQRSINWFGHGTFRGIDVSLGGIRTIG